MVNKKTLAVLLFFGFSTWHLSAQQIFAPTPLLGTTTTSGVGINTSVPNASLDLRAHCSSTNIATFSITGFSSSFLTCGFPNVTGDLMRVRTQTGVSTFNENFIIKSGTGRVGIGIASPATLLHVNNGSLKFTGTDPVHGAPNIFWGGTTSSAPNGEWALEYNSGMKGLNFWRPNLSHLSNGTTISTVNNVLFLSDDNRVGIGTATPSALLTVRGNVLIGNPSTVTLPGSYGLYVENGILTSRVKVATVNAANWSDFVFAPGYRLKPVHEVNAFIQANQHLPGMPSAKQVEEEGYDVAQMDAALLLQIEELWLHLIQLKQENEELKKKLKN